MSKINEVLVATDFGPQSAAALDWARAIARSFGARMRLLHVVDDIAQRVTGFPQFTSELDRVQATIETEARTRVDALLSDDDRQALRASSTVLTSPEPPKAIVEFAREERVDLIVMGTHGRRAIAHWFLGSVAEHVVRSAPCPVVTVRAVTGEETHPQAAPAAAFV